MTYEKPSEEITELTFLVVQKTSKAAQSAPRTYAEILETEGIPWVTP